MDEWSVEGRQRKRPFSLNLKCAAAAGSNFDLFFSSLFWFVQKRVKANKRIPALLLLWIKLIWKLKKPPASCWEIWENQASHQVLEVANPGMHDGALASARGCRQKGTNVGLTSMRSWGCQLPKVWLVLPMIKYLAAMQMDRVLIMCESTSLPFFDKGRREPLRDDKVENFYSLCGNGLQQ